MPTEFLSMSTEKVWIFLKRYSGSKYVGHRAAELLALKFGGQKKNYATRPGTGESALNLAEGQNLFLTSNFDSR